MAVCSEELVCPRPYRPRSQSHKEIDGIQCPDIVNTVKGTVATLSNTVQLLANYSRRKILLSSRNGAEVSRRIRLRRQLVMRCAASTTAQSCDG
jgi:hypothetical protein